jgi:hypothetical protein
MREPKKYNPAQKVRKIKNKKYTILLQGTSGPLCSENKIKK